MTPEQVARRIASAIHGDYPEMLLVADIVDGHPTRIRVEATDNDTEAVQVFHLTVDAD